MRDTVLALIDDDDPAIHERIRGSVDEMVADVSSYVPGYRLKQRVQIVPVPSDQPVHTITGGASATHQVTVFLEVEGAAHYLPSYAGNLDIMTSAALRVGERIAERLGRESLI
jgi:acetaldehyde dehydrogenase